MLATHKNKTFTAMLLIAAVLALALFAGCGGSPMSGKSSDEADVFYAISDNVADAGGIAQSESGAPNLSPGGAKQRGHAENVKLVYTANLRLQTIDYAKAEVELAELVDRLGGYFEYSYVDRGGYYSDGSRMTGSYTVRVPAAKFEELLSSVGDVCHVVSVDRSVEDIGMEYFDVETRLNTLRTKLERLTALLERANVMSDIIELENSIASTQYDIDWYTSTLNRYDSLVGFSTVHISLEQVARLTGGVSEAEGFFPALWRSLRDGFANFADSLQGVVLWTAYNLLTLAVLAAVLFGLCKWRRKRKMEGKFLLPPLPSIRSTRRKRKDGNRPDDGEDSPGKPGADKPSV